MYGHKGDERRRENMSPEKRRVSFESVRNVSSIDCQNEKQIVNLKSILRGFEWFDEVLRD